MRIGIASHSARRRRWRHVRDREVGGRARASSATSCASWRATSTRCGRTRVSSRRCTSCTRRRSRCRRPPSTRPPTAPSCAARSGASRTSCCRRCATGSTRNGLEALVVENAWAIPMHLPLGLALRDLAEETGLPAIGHHHDYWWERDRFASCVVPEVLAAAFPPDLPNVRHVSINSLAAAQLLARRGLASTVVPNVFDFDQPRPGPHRESRCGAAPPRARHGRRRAARRPADAGRPAQGHRAGDRARRAAAATAKRCCSSPAPPATRGRSTSSRSSGSPTGRNVRLRYAADRFAPDDEGKRINPARLALRRVPRRRPHHLPEPVRGLRQRARRGALLRLTGGREPVRRLRRRHPAARAAHDRDRRRHHRCHRRRGARGPCRSGAARPRRDATTSGSDASISATTSCAGHCRSSSRGCARPSAAARA